MTDQMKRSVLNFMANHVKTFYPKAEITRHKKKNHKTR